MMKNLKMNSTYKSGYFPLFNLANGSDALENDQD